MCAADVNLSSLCQRAQFFIKCFSGSGRAMANPSTMTDGKAVVAATVTLECVLCIAWEIDYLVVLD